MQKLSYAVKIITLSFTFFILGQNAYSAFETKSQFNVAINAGVNQATLNQRYLDQTTTIKQNISTSALQSGYLFGLNLGYEQFIKEVYLLGIEFSAKLMTGYSRFDSGANSTAFTDVTKVKYVADLSLVPGMKLSELMIAYVKLGLAWGYFTDRLSSPAGFIALNETHSNSKSQIGLLTGIGIRHALSNCSYIFAEYNFYDYHRVNFSNFENFSAAYRHSTTVTASTIFMGVGYHF